jgi:hypothetical protein
MTADIKQPTDADLARYEAYCEIKHDRPPTIRTEELRALVVALREARKALRIADDCIANHHIEGSECESFEAVRQALYPMRRAARIVKEAEGC